MNTDMAIDFCRELKVAIESWLLRGSQRFLLMPSNPVAQDVARHLLGLDCGAQVHFVNVQRLATGVCEIDQSGLAAAIGFCADVIVVCEDYDKCTILSAANRVRWQALPHVVIAGNAHHGSDDRLIRSAEARCEVPSHAVGYGGVKRHIYDALRFLVARHSSGVIAELGTFRGGTLLLVKELMLSLGYTGPTLVGFDTFSGFPPRRSLLDLFYMERFCDNDVTATQKRLSRNGIEIVQGDIVETKRWLADKEVLLTFFDTDNYSPVAAALPLCFERTVPGGFLIFDHYYTNSEYLDTIGERIAAEEFFRARSDYLHLSGTGVFVKAP